MRFGLPTSYTYLPTWQGFLYLAVIIDAWSRRVVGWSMATHLKTELVLDALEMALWNRRPAPGLIHHSDSEDMSADVLGLPDPHSDGRVGTLVPGGA